jgi:hypothetical protein
LIVYKTKTSNLVENHHGWSPKQPQSARSLENTERTMVCPSPSLRTNPEKVLLGSHNPSLSN